MIFSMSFSYERSKLRTGRIIFLIIRLRYISINAAATRDLWVIHTGHYFLIDDIHIIFDILDGSIDSGL